MQMVQIAVERGADMDQIQKFMDLAERAEKNEAQKAYVSAMSEFRAECPSINKTRQAHNSTYAGLAETIEQIKDLLAKNGLSHSWRTDQADNQISVTCCVTHRMGHSECTTLTAAPDSTGSKNSIQAIASTVSYLERYTLYAILGLASKDMDDDAVGAEPAKLITDEQVLSLHAKAEEHGVLDNFTIWLSGPPMKVKAISDIRADMLELVEKALDKAIKAREKKNA